MTPLDLVSAAADETHPIVTNIARFLQTLDDDIDPSNGISITEAVRRAAKGKSINFDQGVIAFENDPNVRAVVAELTSGTSTGTRILIPTQTARSHLKDTLDTIYEQLRPPRPVALEGVWVVTSIEGIPVSAGGPSRVDASNSTWTFHSNPGEYEKGIYDGKYEWFVSIDREALFLNIALEGRYDEIGENLWAEGMSGAVIEIDTFKVSYDTNNGAHTISFLDHDGNRWTYTKVQ